MAIAAGVFGAPSYVSDGEVFWGQDRLGQLAETLAGKGAACAGWYGTLKGIFIAELAAVEMESVPDVLMKAGIGVEGDRYAMGRGYYSGKPHADRQVTLIEEETLEALARDHSITVLPEETRRNLLTRGVPLNHLVGRRFRIGEVELYGGRLNVPCKYLERLLDRKVFDPLINRSGLNCRILNTGRIHVGDPIVPVD
jgi:MOSC domain-containing protein YiiM